MKEKRKHKPRPPGFWRRFSKILLALSTPLVLLIVLLVAALRMNNGVYDPVVIAAFGTIIVLIAFLLIFTPGVWPGISSVLRWNTTPSTGTVRSGMWESICCGVSQQW